ncbi:hypothetical protein B296_00044211 [Ensete ventricosum]|uniref:Uncharacterized protein n=1 Tax=Ensete ventricosum TaxID=4639 RepID=A0A426ZBN4_ENSVE|nr:hypothetical protein B296_00044211 [Ensete ventricosum]
MLAAVALKLIVEAWQTVIAVVVWQLIVDVAEARRGQIAELYLADFVEGQVVQLTGLLQAVSAAWWTGLTENWIRSASEAAEKIAVGLFASEIAAAAAAAEYVVARVKIVVISASITVVESDAGIEIDFVFDAAVEK